MFSFCNSVFSNKWKMLPKMYKSHKNTSHHYNGKVFHLQMEFKEKGLASQTKNTKYKH